MGCFPLDIAPSRPMSVSFILKRVIILINKKLYLFKKKIPTQIYKRPYLDTFRGEPAITKFDRLITPNYRSS